MRFIELLGRVPPDALLACLVTLSGATLVVFTSVVENHCILTGTRAEVWAWRVYRWFVFGLTCAGGAYVWWRVG